MNSAEAQRVGLKTRIGSNTGQRQGVTLYVNSVDEGDLATFAKRWINKTKAVDLAAGSNTIEIVADKDTADLRVDAIRLQ